MRLHDYQIVGRDFLRGRDRAGLWLDMGLGKSAICLTALEPRHLPVLVLAPKQVAETVWNVEKDLWRPDLTLARATGSPAERAASLASDADIIVLGRDNQGDLERVRRSKPFSTLIIDELSGYKSSASARYKTARRLIARQAIPHVWGLTGTPSPNGLLDIWSQVALLDGGARLGKNMTAYRHRFFTPGRQLPSGVIIEWNLRPGAEEEIYSLLGDLCLSMETEGRVTLPPVTYNPIPVILPDRARAAYRRIKDDLVVDLRDIYGEVHTAANAAILTSKLSQISAGFLYVDDADLRDGAYTPIHTAKIEAVRAIVDVATSPVLVFYHFKAELEMLRAAFPAARTISPDSIVEWNAGRVPVMLAHPASAGHGLNLQHGGHTIVWTTLPWSLEEWEQANKRLARQGQKHPVVIHTVVAEKSIDHLILKRLQDKAVVQDSLMEYLESPI